LNPGPLGCQPSTTDGLRYAFKRKVNYCGGVCVEIIEDLITEFESCLRLGNPRIRVSTIKQYMYYIPELKVLKLHGKEDIAKVFEVIELNKSSYKAFQGSSHSLEKTGEFDELVMRLRKTMPKKPKVRADTYIPDDGEILKVRDRIRKLGTTTVYANLQCIS